MKTRSIKELLIILRDNEKYFIYGLCELSNDLHTRGVITASEHSLIKDFILTHPTARYKSGLSIFYWEPCVWTFRLKFLNKWINKL